MTTIQRKTIPTSQRLRHTVTLFGAHFPLRLEPVVYTFADRLSEDYDGGYWTFYELSNGGFYMAPEVDTPFRVCCDNGFEGSLSGDALGVTVCLYAYSHLAFGNPSQFTETCAEQYHRLRDYALDHPEARGILAAID